MNKKRKWLVAAVAGSGSMSAAADMADPSLAPRERAHSG